jgi:hypothetical protein
VDLICYLHPGWEPLIRPAEATRDWMTATPESFAYRCLPLNIANAHGWEILWPFGFSACWAGGSGTDAVLIHAPPNADPVNMPVSLFGQGVLTFHVAGLFRTPPGWNLWVGGSPNRFKDGISALTGIVETDWAPYTFTMNWRFTRPNHWVQFEAGEPICFVFPVKRGYLDEVTAKFVPMQDDPEVLEQYRMWSRSRDEFHARMAREQPPSPSDKWQKDYYRGVDARGQTGAPDHATKLRLQAFKPGKPPAREADAQPPVRADHAPPPVALQPAPAAALLPNDAEAPAPSAQPAASTALLALRKRDWLLDITERHHELAPGSAKIERRIDLSRDEFLERYYSANRPVILVGEMVDWAALSRWTPKTLREAVGSRIIEYQGERTQNERFEMYKDAHRREMPFDAFIDAITQIDGNDAYITAYNSNRNAEALSVLHRDLGFLDKFLTRNANPPHGMMWIGPAGTITSLHHDLTNNFIAQLVGRKRFRIAPAADVAKLYNHQYVFSEITDLEDPALDRKRFPLLAGARVFDVTLNPGEIIFMPIAWWHQVRALDFSVTITYTNFLWPNGAHASYPSE